MVSLAKIGRGSLLMIGVVALSCGATYYVTNKTNEAKIAELQNQVDSLNNHVLQARVTQRISEQMEDIASQQSIISNQERDRAEKQSHIAEQERNRAEQERGLALEAQNQALASAAEARKQQAIAEEQREKATENMIIAENARAQADTLLYSALSSSLAQSAITQGSLGNTKLSNLLAYASWYYLKTYRGNELFQPTLYTALLNASGTESAVIVAKGNIRKIRVVDDGTAIGITDYGEVILSDTTRTIVGSLGQAYNMLDFYTYGRQKSIALCSDGRLLQFDATGLVSNQSKFKQVSCETKLQLPQGFWKRLVGIDHGATLIAMADDKVAWIDAKTMQLLGTANTKSKTTALGKQGSVIHVFCEGGNHYISNESGQLVPLNLSTLPLNEKITCFLYNKAKHLTFLGTYEGKVLVYNEEGQKQADFFYNSGPVTDMHVIGNKLGVTGYSQSLSLWNLESLHNNSTPVGVDLDRWALCFDADDQSQYVWAGLANGALLRFSSNMEANANTTYGLLTREFTMDEWNTFVGKDIPRLYFLKR